MEGLFMYIVFHNGEEYQDFAEYRRNVARVACHLNKGMGRKPENRREQMLEAVSLILEKTYSFVQSNKNPIQI